MSKKIVYIMCYLVFFMLITISGTRALLIDTDGLVNTFTHGDIEITLDETDTKLDNDEDDNTNIYEMFPGGVIVKDPTITVISGSETCWLFVKIEEVNNFENYLEYEIAPGWTKLSDEDNVWVHKVDEEDIAKENLELFIIKDNTVYVKDNVTKDMLEELEINAENTEYPRLDIYAYAVQYAGFEEDAREAWQAIMN